MAAAVDKHAIATRIDGIISVGIERSLKVVEEFEVTFTTPIIEKLSNLKMREIVRRKNPYLYRASGVSTCEELVNRAFTEYTSTLGENYFGSFFESVARIISGGVKPASGGEIDLDVRRDNDAYLYTIKSGPGGYNSSIEAKARLDLGHAEQRLRQDRVTTYKKMAYAYGRRKTSFKDGIEKLASKDFWHELSGDEEFYLKLLDVCAELTPLFEADTNAPYQMLLNEAHELFCEGDSIRWDKVIRIVSG